MKNNKNFSFAISIILAVFIILLGIYSTYDLLKTERESKKASINFLSEPPQIKCIKQICNIKFPHIIQTHDQFNPLWDFLKRVPPYYVINLHINGAGGAVSILREIIAALQTVPNKKVVYVDGIAASSYGILALVFANREMKVNPYGKFLVHQGKYMLPMTVICHADIFVSYPQCMRELRRGLDQDNQYLYKIAFPYLHNTERRAVKAGKDVWISNTIILQRIFQRLRGDG